MVADILPTGYEVGVLNGQRRTRRRRRRRRRRTDRPGRRSSAHGSTARATSSRSTWPTRRLEAAKQFGADVVVNTDREDAVAGRARADRRPRRRRRDRGRRMPETFELARSPGPPRRHIANIGVHGKPATLHLEDLWIKDVTITTGLVDTVLDPDAPGTARGSARRRRVRDAPTSRSTSSCGPTTCSRTRATRRH